jgi:RNA polymerase sigma-70 factor (ECF subfamily)
MTRYKSAFGGAFTNNEGKEPHELTAVANLENTPSFDSLFAAEYPRVVAIAKRIVGESSEAEDVAQEVFAAFARSRSADAAGVAGWLRSAAVHTALNFARARKRRIERERSEERLHRPLRETSAHTHDPQVVVDREHRRALVRDAMLRLDPRAAEILALRYGGLSYAEIADALRVDAAQIGTRLARAERAFKKEIEREAS